MIIGGHFVPPVIDSCYLCHMNIFNRTLLLFIFIHLVGLPSKMIGENKKVDISLLVQNFSVNEYNSSCQNWDLHVSPDGNLYVANNSGLLVFDGNTWHLYKTPQEEAVYEVGERNDTIFTVCELSKGYWMRDSINDLSYHTLPGSYSLPDISNPNHRVSFPVTEEIKSYKPKAFVRLSQYDIVGTQYGGLFFLDKSGNILQHLTTQNQIEDNCVHAICVQDESRLWVAFDNGISQIDINPPISMIGKRSEIGKIENAGKHGDNIYVKTNLGYFKKPLWSGESFIRVEKTEATKFMNEQVATLSLSPEKIFSDIKVIDYFKDARYIYPTYDNMYWLLYKNEAALVQEKNHQTFLKCRLLFDNYNFDLTTRGPHFFTLNDSLYAVSTMQGALLINIRQLLGSSRHVTMPKFEKIEYRDKEGTHILQPNTSSTIKLPHEAQLINLFIGTTVFTSIHHISYKLDGIRDDWTDWEKSGEISFSYLPEGKHTLRIRKYVSQGAFPEMTITIEVLPAWYDSIWAYILYISFIIILVQQTLKYNLRRLKREEKELKEQNARAEKHEQELIRSQALENELELKNNELMLQTSALVRRNQAIQSILEEYERQKEELGDRYPNKLYKKLHQQIVDALEDKEEWSLFEGYFKNAHQLFMEKLQQKYPDLTTGDLRVCCLLRMNLSTKEVASLLNISVRAVELRRYRLRKRLGLNNDVNLVEFLLNL